MAALRKGVRLKNSTTINVDAVEVVDPVGSVVQMSFAQILNTAQHEELSNNVARAIDIYRTWLTEHANTSLAYLGWYEFGRLLDKNGEHERSAAAFAAVLEQKPDFAMAALALGNQLERKGQADQAIVVWRKCIESGGEKVVLLNNIGRVCDALYRHEEAEAALRQSWQLNSQQPEVISTLMHLRQRLCQWPINDPSLGLSEARLPDYFGPIASLAMFNDPVLNLESTKVFLKSKGYDAIIPQSMPRRLQDRPQKDRGKIRVGFLSADFRMHATSVFFGSLLEKLDRSQFEVHALDITVHKEVFGTVREELLSKVDHCLALQTISDEDAIEKIRALDLDILVDMAGLTAGARPVIVSHRVAPVQIAYLGFIGSCGIGAVDYILTTSDLLIPEYALDYCEKPLYLPGPYFVMNQDLVDLGSSSLTKEQCGLPQDAFVYCALLNSYKITQPVFECWLRILNRVQSSVLWLVGDNETVKRNLTMHAAQMGIDSARLVFTQRVHPGQFRAYLSCADLFLDTSPYGNGATAREAILANLPILTCPGNTMMSRLSAHLMGQLQMNDFIARDWNGYEELAVKLGDSPVLIKAYKEQMIQARNSSLLFDADRFARDFGQTLLEALSADS
jgi:predicted O-linked N-acetylglucosamine transferase (SPINDLY family)